MDLDTVQLAIVHDYLNQFGGAERVVATFHRIFPDSPIFTSIYAPDRTFPEFRAANICTSFMQHLPGVARWYRAYLALYPLAFERFDFHGFDVVLSSSSGWAHGIRTPPGTLHICYCYTPARWLWDLDRYLDRDSLRASTKKMIRPIAAVLRRRDAVVSRRPHHYVAISRVVAERIRRLYQREATVIYPPVDVEKFVPGEASEDYYLVVSRLGGYKNLELVVDAFNTLKLPLRIIGDGPMRSVLQQRAGDNIRFLGAVSDAELVRQYACCRALIFPGDEDFGMAPLEANASGRPVIALARGGALETVRDGVTGIFFQEPTVTALASAVLHSQPIDFTPLLLRRHAEQFSISAFQKKMTEFVHCVYSQHSQGFRSSCAETSSV